MLGNTPNFLVEVGKMSLTRKSLASLSRLLLHFL